MTPPATWVRPQLYGNGNGKKGCENLTDVAEQAKGHGITVLVIGFGDARSASCEKPGTRTPRSPWVRDYLAASASPGPGGAASKAESDCSTTAERTAENKDGDYYYCAASGAGARSDLRHRDHAGDGEHQAHRAAVGHGAGTARARRGTRRSGAPLTFALSGCEC